MPADIDTQAKRAAVGAGQDNTKVRRSSRDSEKARYDDTPKAHDAAAAAPTSSYSTETDTDSM